MILDPNNVYNAFAIMSIVGALVLVAIAIVAYPTLQKKSRGK